MLRELSDVGCGVLIATHDLAFASETADRCAMFFGGRLTSCAKTHRFFSSNRFYTTQAARLTRDRIPVSVTADEAIAALGKRGGKTV